MYTQTTGKLANIEHMRVLLTIILLACGVIAKAETVTAAQDAWPPFIATNGQSGVSVELVRAALATQGYELKMSIMPWSRALIEAQSGDLDLLVATWKTQKREKFLRFSEPYATNRITFISRSDSPFEYTNLDNLTGMSIGIIRHYGYNDTFNQANNFQRYPATDLIANLKKLSRRRIDITLDDEIAARALMKAEGFDPSEFHFSRAPLSHNPLYVTSAMVNPRSKQLIQAFNRGLKAIKDNGSYDAIMNKYGM